MTNPQPPACPYCGSRQLIARKSNRRVFINKHGERIPLLTLNYTLDHPIMEESTTTYTCSCSWRGDETALTPEP